jgi:hypothetical protein
MSDPKALMNFATLAAIAAVTVTKTVMARKSLRPGTGLIPLIPMTGLCLSPSSRTTKERL